MWKCLHEQKYYLHDPWGDAITIKVVSNRRGWGGNAKTRVCVCVCVCTHALFCLREQPLGAQWCILSKIISTQSHGGCWALMLLSDLRTLKKKWKRKGTSVFEMQEFHQCLDGCFALTWLSRPATSQHAKIQLRGVFLWQSHKPTKLVVENGNSDTFLILIAGISSAFSFSFFFDRLSQSLISMGLHSLFLCAASMQPLAKWSL